MKYSIETLLDRNEALSHLFLEALGKDKELSDKIPRKDEYEIELFIEGHSVNPKAFFDRFTAQYEDMVHAHAVELIRKKMGGVIEKLSSMEEAVEHLGQDINWNVENPFKESA